jgi:pyruvate dehydrogenase E1 component beta subunit
VLAPYDCEDYKSLLKSAIRDPNPVVFLENEMMYSETFDVSAEVMDPNYLGEIGKAKVMREGKHVTIVALSKMVKYALEAATEMEKLGVSCEVINLRSIRPLDRTTIIKSVKKTNRLVAVEEGWPQSGISAEICALMMETNTFFHLDAPV